MDWSSVSALPASLVFTLRTKRIADFSWFSEPDSTEDCFLRSSASKRSQLHPLALRFLASGDLTIYSFGRHRWRLKPLKSRNALLLERFNSANLALLVANLSCAPFEYGSVAHRFLSVARLVYSPWLLLPVVAWPPYSVRLGKRVQATAKQGRCLRRFKSRVLLRPAEVFVRRFLKRNSVVFNFLVERIWAVNSSYCAASPGDADPSGQAVP